MSSGRRSALASSLEVPASTSAPGGRISASLPAAADSVMVSMMFAVNNQGEDSRSQIHRTTASICYGSKI